MAKAPCGRAAFTGSCNSVELEQAVAQDANHGPDCVLPADFLALDVGAPEIRNTDFINPHARDSRDLRGQLGLDAEALLAQPQTLQHLATKELVAGLHVAEVQVRAHV